MVQMCSALSLRTNKSTTALTNNLFYCAYKETSLWSSAAPAMSSALTSHRTITLSNEPRISHWYFSMPDHFNDVPSLFWRAVVVWNGEHNEKLSYSITVYVCKPLFYLVCVLISFLSCNNGKNMLVRGPWASFFSDTFPLLCCNRTVPSIDQQLLLCWSLLADFCVCGSSHRLSPRIGRYVCGPWCCFLLLDSMTSPCLFEPKPNQLIPVTCWPLTQPLLSLSLPSYRPATLACARIFTSGALWLARRRNTLACGRITSVPTPRRTWAPGWGPWTRPHWCRTTATHLSGTTHAHTHAQHVSCMQQHAKKVL